MRFGFQNATNNLLLLISLVPWVWYHWKLIQDSFLMDEMRQQSQHLCVLQKNNVSKKWVLNKIKKQKKRFTLMSLISYNKSYFVNQPSDLRGLMSVRYFQAGLYDSILHILCEGNYLGNVEAVCSFWCPRPIKNY